MKAALFDLDGVIVDTEGTYSQFWASVGKKFGLRATFANDIKGTTLTDILNSNFPDPADRLIVTQMIHDFENTMKYPVFSGVLEFLKKLKNASFKIALVTSSDDVKMSYLKKQHPHLMDYFDVVITASKVTKSKPDPEGYLLAAHELGVDIKDCYVFEDSLQGVEAGYRSGATVIGLATTNPARLLKDKAHKVIDNFIGLNIGDLEHD